MGNITSLSEFILAVKELDNKYYFRGEPKSWRSMKMIASGFRLVGERDSSQLVELREKYFEEIGYGLNEKDQENFISYSQHHGIPTELLDVTTNPLVALYFACIGNESVGNVYALLKSNTVNLEKNIIHNKLAMQYFNFDQEYFQFKNMMFNNQVSCEQSTEKLFLDISKDGESLFGFLKSSVKKQKKEIDARSINEKIYYPIDIVYGVNKNGNNRFLDKKFTESIEKINSEITTTVVSGNSRALQQILMKQEYQDILSDHFKNLSFYHSCRLDEQFALFLFILCVDIVKNPMGTCNSSSISDDIDNNIGDVFPPLKYLIHQPSIIFDRMVNQQGKFIYQLSLLNSKEKAVIQKVTPNITFTIQSKDKKDILKELDAIGINEKFIYPDPDHIANYVKNKW